MNYAFVDASWHELPDGYGVDGWGVDGWGVGGWGLVLLQPEAMPKRFGGRLQAPDNNAAELRAVLEAVRLAPVGQALSIYTDNQAVIACVARGRGPHALAELTREVLDEAAARQIVLGIGYAPRHRRHMLVAHDLANEARKGITGTISLAQQQTDAEIIIDQHGVFPKARLSLRRSHEQVTAHIDLDPLCAVPPSAQALLAAVNLAKAGEVVVIRRASKIAKALWNKPERTLLEEAKTRLLYAKAQAEFYGISVLFSA